MSEDLLKDVDPELVKHVINTVIPFKMVLASVGIEISGREETIYCPFHPNTETKAAKLFRDDGGDRIWCFTERKMYFPYDVFRLGLSKKNPETIFRRIWAQLNEGNKEALIQSMNTPIDTMPENWDEVVPVLDAFKRGENSFDEVLDSLLKLRTGLRV